MSNRTHWSASPLGILPGWALALLLLDTFLKAQSSGIHLLTGMAACLLFGLLYLGASRWQRKSLGEVSRGIIIGLSSGLNGALLWWMTGWAWLSGGVVILLSASAFLWLSRHTRYHTLLGWANWLLPLSWPVNLPGALMLLVNLLFAPLGYVHPLFRPIRIKVLIDPSTSSFSCFGGLIRPVKGFSGLNMGNFIFINPGWEHLLRHEIGHLFSLASMGGPFHYIGGLDEGLVQSNYWEAYAEHLADSYSTPTATVLSVWR